MSSLPAMLTPSTPLSICKNLTLLSPIIIRSYDTICIYVYMEICKAPTRSGCKTLNKRYLHNSTSNITDQYSLWFTVTYLTSLPLGTY